MDDGRKENTTSELKNFYKKLRSYQNRQHRRDKIGFTEAQDRSLNALRLELQREYGRLKDIILEYGGSRYITRPGESREAFHYVLSTLDIQDGTFIALDSVISVVNEAIGKIEATPLAEFETKESYITESPKAFIAHGGRTGVVDKLCDFIRALGIEPIIVELSASQGMTVDAKVNKYVKDADFGIVLATKGGIVDEKNKKQHPRLNVIDELERLRAVFPDKTILLLENGVDLPSNISGLTYERFARQSMDRAFSAIARELVAFGILKTVKPQ